MTIADFFQNPLIGNKNWSTSQDYNVLLSGEGYHQGWDQVTPARIDPVTELLIHQDRVGDVIRSAGNGTIVYTGDPGHNWGNVVIVQHQLSDGTFVLSISAHLNEILVDQGDVTVGQPIGTMGNAGGSFRTHLHFGIFLGQWGDFVSAFDLLGIGYLDAPDPTPFSDGWVDPEWFISQHTDATGVSWIHGNDGNDSDTLAPGRTAIFGKALDDNIQSYAGNDLVSGLAGKDTIDGGSGRDTLFGGADNDILLAYSKGADSLDGGDGFDGLWLDRSDLLKGQNLDLTSASPIFLTDGTSLENIEWYDLQTGSGNDRIVISGSVNEQHIGANGGRDRAVLDFSSEVGDVIFKRIFDAALSDSVISVNPGRQQAIRISGFEDFTVLGGSGNDLLDAQYMLSAVLRGNDGNDRLFGTNGVDQLFGGDGNDRILGFNCHLGPDGLYGGLGDDTLVGTGDGTLLDGGIGNDVLTGGTGGTGFDQFIFGNFFGRDTITDFEAGPGVGDTIHLSALNLSLSDLKIASAQSGLSTKITVIATGDSILLAGVSIASLDLTTDLIL